MEIFIIIAAAIVAFVCAFISAVLSSYPQDKVNESIELKIHNSDILQRLKLHNSDSKEALFLMELLFYIISFAITGVFLFINGYMLYYIVAITIVSFFIILLIRISIWGIGTKYSHIFIFKLAAIAYITINIIYPIHLLLEKITQNISGKAQDEASRDEINAMFETAHEEGSIEADEYRILKNIMHFSDVLVTDVMTPRTVIFSCHADKTVADIVSLPEIRMYSRFPIYNGESIDDGVVGYVMSKDILYSAISGKTSKKIRDFAREVYIIPENAELDNALEQFLQRRQHIAVVVDEYGGVEGLLTMEDVLETILGVEIVDEADKVVDMREAAKQRRDKRIESLNSTSTE